MINITKISNEIKGLNMQFIVPLVNELNNLNHLLKISKGHWGYEDKFCQEFVDEWGLTEDYFANSILYKVVDEHKLIGIIGLSMKENKPYLDYFFLQPEYIGKGLGRKMWHKVIQICKQQGWHSFELYSDPNAEPIYHSLGATTIGAYESFPGRKVPLMQYILNY